MSVYLGFSKHIALYHILHSSLHLSHTLSLVTRIVKPLHVHYAHNGGKFCVATGAHIFIYDAHQFALMQHVSDFMDAM